MTLGEIVDDEGAALPARCLDEIVKVMREKGLALDILVSEIQDWLSIAGYDVPLRSYDPQCAHRFDSGLCVALSGHEGPHVTSNAEFPHGRGGGSPPPPSAPEPSIEALEAALKISVTMWPTNAPRSDIIEAAVRAAYAVDFRRGGTPTP